LRLKLEVADEVASIVNRKKDKECHIQLVNNGWITQEYCTNNVHLKIKKIELTVKFKLYELRRRAFRIDF